VKKSKELDYTDKKWWLFKFFPFLMWTPMLKEKGIIRNDILAGIVAGILILPQAIALATIAGMPPEYGLYTSIFPVIFTAMYGSSWHVLSGPNTAIVVMVSMAVAPLASIQTSEYIAYVITLTFMVGVVQMFFAYMKFGAAFAYFSHTVMVAIVTSVGFVIIIQQVGDFMGITINKPEPIEDTVRQLFFSIIGYGSESYVNWYAFTIGFSTFISGYLIKKFVPKIPYLIAAVAIGMIVGFILDLIVDLNTVDVYQLGNLSLSALPLSAPDFAPETFARAAVGLIPAAFIIAIIGLIQSTVIAKTMSVQSGQPIDMNQEVMGQGVSNVAGSFLSCFPSAGSFNRSASNMETGGKTPVVAIVSALFLAFLIFVAAPILAEMPLPVMAGVLVLVGMGLIKPKEIKQMLKVRGAGRWIFIITFASSIYGGLEYGVIIGAFFSIVAYLKSVSVPDIELLFSEEADSYNPDDVENTTVLHITGSLFFGSIAALEFTFGDLAHEDQRKKTLVIAGENITNMDQAGYQLFIAEVNKRRKAGGDFHLWLNSHKLDEGIKEFGLLDVIGEDHIHYTTEVYK
jgi:sulfate permease, SulP family